MRRSIQLLVCGSSAIAFAFVYFTYKVYKNRQKYKHIPGRKAQGISGFYLGHASEMIDDMTKNKIFPDKFVEDIEKYGSVIKYAFLGSTILHTVDPDAIKEILVTENYQKHPSIYKTAGYPLGERLIGTGLVTELDEEKWKQRRSLFNPGFYRQELMKHVSIFNAKADLLMEKLEKLADGKTPIRLFDELNHATLDLIANIAFGIETNAINDSSNKLNSYISVVAKNLDTFILDPYAPLKPSKIPIINLVKKNIRILRQFAKETILERIDKVKNDEYIPNDILSMILKTADKQNFDIEAMVDDFLTFLFAGQETTATALSILFLEIGKHPDIFEKLAKEVDEVIGECAEVNYEHVNNLRYTDAVWKEVLRLYPSAPQFSRMTTKEMIIDGKVIPSGSWMVVSPYSSGRCSKFFPDPTKFDPDRFFDENKKKNNIINGYTYYPFSLGPRHCIGQNFATIEAKIIIAKIMQRFEIILDQSQSFDIIQVTTLRPKDGTRCFLKFRKA